MDSKTEVPSEVTDEEKESRAKELEKVVKELTHDAVEQMKQGHYQLGSWFKTSISGEYVTATNESNEGMQLFGGVTVPPGASFFWHVDDGPVMVDASAVLEDGAEAILKPVENASELSGADLRAIVVRGKEASAEEALFVMFDDVLSKAIAYTLDELSAEAKPHRGRREGSGNRAPIPDKSKVTLDPVSNALMSGPVRSQITPQNYFDRAEVPVKASKKGYVLLSASAPEDTDIDADYKEYGLGDRERFWLDAVTSFAATGERKIKGTDLLRFYDYKNPYDDGCIPIINEAAKALLKCRNAEIRIDTTNEKRIGEPRIVRAATFRKALGAAITFEELVEESEDGEKVYRDFEIELPNSPDPFEGLPIAQYADQRNMIATIDQELYRFAASRPSDDTRRAWAIVVRLVWMKNTNGKVLMDTLFTTLDLEPIEVDAVYVSRGVEKTRTPKQIEAERKKRENARRKRICDGLLKILHEKAGGREEIPDPDNPGKKKTVYRYPRMIEKYSVDYCGAQIKSITIKKKTP